MWTIEIEYQTGDSFSSEERIEIVGAIWNDLEKAKFALNRIKEHYKWYQYQEHPRWNDKVEKPDWMEINRDETIITFSDDNEQIRISAFWCGYFELLREARIIPYKENINDSDMSFVP